MRILLFMMLCISLQAQDRNLLHPENWRIIGDTVAVSGENHEQTISMFVQKKGSTSIMAFDNINPKVLFGEVDLVFEVRINDFENGTTTKNKYSLSYGDKGFFIQDKRIILTYNHDLWQAFYWDMNQSLSIEGWIVGSNDQQFFQLSLKRFGPECARVLNKKNK